MKNCDKKPEILIVVGGFPQLSQSFITLQIAELYKQGSSVKVLNIGTVGEISWIPENHRDIFENIDIYNSNNGLFFIKVFKIVLYNIIKKPIPLIKLLLLHRTKKMNKRDIQKIIRDSYLFRFCGKADIVHCQFANLGFRYSLLKKYGFLKTNGNLVCTIRGYDITRSDVVNEIDWKILFNECSIFLPVCNFFNKKLILMGYKKKIQVIHSPVDTKRLSEMNYIKNDNENKEIKIISVGRLVEKKGFDDALSAMSRLKEVTQDFSYSIIGDGPLLHDIKDFIIKNDLTNNVHLLGNLPSDVTIEMISHADILLAPSKTAKNGNSEGIPNVLKEAMILGLQVIGTEHAGITELIINRKNGFIVSESDPEAIFDTIIEIINDRDSWNERSENAKKTVLNNFNLLKITHELQKVYSEL